MQPTLYPSRYEPTIIEPKDIPENSLSCRGEHYMVSLRMVKAIIAHQLENPTLKGIKGFIFYGDVGTGMTLMAKVLANELSLPMIFVDGSVIARELYGQSEQQIVKIFEKARRTKCLILIDDAESVFPDREWMKGESWHVAQNNILFHQLDLMDTSKCTVVLTTNKYDLLDKALKDRLYPIEFPQPELETIVEIVKLKCLEKKVDANRVIARVRAEPGKFKSVRAVEKMIVEEYITEVEGKVMKKGDSHELR